MKKIRTALFLCLLCIMMTQPVFARAGGGGSGGGSGSGSSSSTHSSHTSGSTRSGILEVLFLLLLSGGSYMVYRVHVYRKHKESKKLLHEIDDLDAVWDEDQLYARVEEIFYATQICHTNCLDSKRYADIATVS